MVQKLLLALSLFLSLAMSTAPAQTPPSSTNPPLLDAPNHWRVHNPAGPMDLKIVAEYIGSDGGSDIYYLTVKGTVNGQPYSSWAMAYDWWDGTSIEVFNGDSELWTTWEWKGDHYEKVGGTANRRSYYPVY